MAERLRPLGSEAQASLTEAVDHMVDVLRKPLACLGLWPAWSAEVLAGGEEPDDLGQEEGCREGPSSLEARACEGFGAEDEAEDDVEALNKELADSLVEALCGMMRGSLFMRRRPVRKTRLRKPCQGPNLLCLSVLEPGTGAWKLRSSLKRSCTSYAFWGRRS